MFHDLTNVLRTLTSRDQQRVVSFDYHEIVHSQSRNEFPRRMNVISFRIQGENAIAHDQVVMLRLRLGGVVFMQRSPRSQIIPAEAGWKTKNVGLVLTLRRTR